MHEFQVRVRLAQLRQELVLQHAEPRFLLLQLRLQVLHGYRFWPMECGLEKVGCQGEVILPGMGQVLWGRRGEHWWSYEPVAVGYQGEVT